MPLTARPLSAYGAYVANGQIVAPDNPRFTQAVALGWNWVERLDSDTFDTLVSNRMQPELATKPVAVVMYPSTDFNGAFLRGPMRELMQAYHVMYYEIGADTDVDTCMRDAARAGPVHLAVLGGRVRRGQQRDANCHALRWRGKYQSRG